MIELTEEEKQAVINEHYREKMSRLGRSRSPAKRRAALKNIKKAQAARGIGPLVKKRKRK
jgi:hypothetical protein